MFSQPRQMDFSQLIKYVNNTVYHIIVISETETIKEKIFGILISNSYLLEDMCDIPFDVKK